MRAFIKSCCRVAAVGGIAVFGVLIAMVPSSGAHAEDVEQWLAKSFASSTEPTRSARRMRLGATRTERPRESLTGGSPRISRGKSSKRARSARQRPPVRTASLGDSYQPKPEVGTSLAGRGVRWVAKSGCLDARLRSVVHEVASAFGAVTVNSTCRSRRHNSRVGGAHRSHHLSGNAVDFRVHGRNTRAVYAYLRGHGSVGGIKFYRRGFFHIDLGSRRTW